MRWKAPIAVIVCTLFFFCAMGGCRGADRPDTRPGASGQDSARASGQVPGSELLQVSVALWGLDDALSQKENDQFYQYLKDKFHIELTPVPINWDDYGQKIVLWASSGNLPDIFAMDAVGTNYYRDWLNRELIRPLPSDLSGYPALDEYLRAAGTENLKDAGKLYFIPRRLYDSIQYCVHDRNVFYRWDLAQQAGIRKEPETWDEFGSMLRTIIGKDPERKGIAGLTLVNIKHISGLFWLYSNPAAASDGSGNDYKWIREDGRYIPAVFSGKSLASLVNLREMYEQGLIDREAVSNKGTQGYEAFATGKAAAILMKGYGNLDTMVKAKWDETYPGREFTECVKRARNFPAVDGKSYQCTFKTFWSESYFNSGMSDEKTDRVLSLYNDMLLPETKEFYRFGVLGTDYEKDGGRIIPITPEAELAEKQHSAAVLGSLVEYDDQFQYDPNNFTLDPAIRRMAARDIEIDMRSTEIPAFEDRLTYLSTPAKDKFPIYDYEDMIKVMLSEEPVGRIWDGIVEGYKAKGLDQVIREVNAWASEHGIN